MLFLLIYTHGYNPITDEGTNVPRVCLQLPFLLQKARVGQNRIKFLLHRMTMPPQI